MHTALINIAHARFDLIDPRIAEFVGNLDRVNAAAERSPGFVWRLQSDSGNATDIDVGGDPLFLANMSVWESVEALEKFAYQSLHLEVLQKKSKWFERPTRTPLVLWWVQAGHIPSVAEAKERFELLWRNGPTPAAFTFKERFPPPQE